MAEPSLMALLGPNGSGKSTLFRILSTLLAPQTGHAAICGTQLTDDARSVRLHIGLVFQEPSLDPKLTVRENLCFAGNLYGLCGMPLQQRVAEVAKRLAIDSRLDARVDTLSGGLRRRAEIARAMLHRPRLLLLDEPSSGLDPHARLDLWRYLRSLQATENVAVLASTHFLDEAALCDQIVILHEGRVAIQGEPNALREELGGEVVEIVSDRASELGDLLAPRAGFHVKVVDDVVRVECPNGPALIANLSATHGSWFRELRMHRPSLADVYFHATGELFRP
jgi:ABC-2 type transport system ATP-binding protein